MFLRRSGAGARPRCHQIKAAEHLACWTSKTRILPSEGKRRLPRNSLCKSSPSRCSAINIYVDISPLMRK